MNIIDMMHHDEIQYLHVLYFSKDLARLWLSACILKTYPYNGALQRAKGAQRSTMGKKIWLSIHPRKLQAFNFPD